MASLTRIVNEAGVGHKTKIFSGDGRDLTPDIRVRSMDIHLECGKEVVATMEVVLPAIDVCAFMSEVSRQQWEDRIVKQLVAIRALKDESGGAHG